MRAPALASLLLSAFFRGEVALCETRDGLLFPLTGTVERVADQGMMPTWTLGDLYSLFDACTLT